MLEVTLPGEGTPAAERSRTLRTLKRDLERYFRGHPVNFGDVPVRINVSGKPREVLELVREIPYGTVVTYGDIAQKSNTHPRVVGISLALNRTPIIVPCHRVVATDGLGGFRWGLEWKRRLLELEGALPSKR
ncbi:methylated-DNA--[protein]-cysteine S-methyltransferase [Methanopyrus sp.]